MDIGEIKVDVGVGSDENKSKGSKSKSNIDTEVTSPKSKGSKRKVDTESTSPNRKSKGSKTKKSASPSASAIRRFTQKRAAKTVGKFMKKTGSKRKAEFLKAICSDSGVCIAFGKERKKILDFFNGFTKFDYLKNIKAIGAVSANGFVKELEYERNGYKAHAILKSSQEKNSDNLMYECYVGKTLTGIARQVPCFVETYGLYEYKTDAYRERFQTEKSGLVDLKNMLTYHKNYSFEKSCTNSVNQCVLIQHIKGAASIGDKIYKGTPDHDFIINDFLYAIYQVYFALGGLATIFTHYDLHPDNVILYKPVDGKYIEFHYHLRDRTVSFKSQYIAKMIDYGRSFINHDNKSSGEYYKKICAEDKCNNEDEDGDEDKDEKCGDNSGYGWMEPPLEKWKYYISSSLNNRSHDLRLLNDLWTRMPWREEPFLSSVRIRSVLKNILGKVRYEGQFGTPPVVGKKDINGMIEDVIDAELFIKTAILTSDQKKANDDYYIGMGKLGDLHVYMDKESEFIPA